MLGYFKANVLFKQFLPSGPADRVLVYLTLYTTQALAKCQTCETAPAALKALTTLAHENFKIPGDAGFTLGTFFPAPQNHQEEGATRLLARMPPRAAAPATGRVRQDPATPPGFLAASDPPRLGRRPPCHAASPTPSSPCATPPPPFPISSLRAVADLCRGYLKQLREELGRRLITKVYLDGQPSKLWLAFAKRKFMNKSL